MSGNDTYSIAPLGLKYLRLSSIIKPDGLFEISRSAWYQGIKDGRYPKPVKLGPRTSLWSTLALQALLNKIEQESLVGELNG